MKRFSLVLLLAGACHGTSAPQYTSLLSTNYASAWMKVRPCRNSIDHNGNNVVVYVDPLAAPTYTGRNGDEFADGATVIKEEHDTTDTTCSGPIIEYTLMQKLPVGSSAQTLDWRWQAIAPDDTVYTQDDKRCISCHEECGQDGDPYGYKFTCEAP